MRHNELSAWLEWLETLHPEEIELGLTRVGSVLNALQLPAPFQYLHQQSRNPQYKPDDGAGLMADSSGSGHCPRVISVAGTNGKGSTVRTLEVLLQNAGLNVGCYTSPHLLSYNERVRINGREVSDAALCQAFDEVDQARGDTSLTYFEFGTLAALQLFAGHVLDVVVLEVGLGGRLDAVNIVDADIAVICSIDIDHQSWLGHDRNVIAKEKAGILRAGIPMVCSDDKPPQSLRYIAEQMQAKAFFINKDFALQVPADCGGSYSWRGVDQHGNTLTLENLPQSDLPAESIAAALQAMYLLGVEPDPAQIHHALSGLQLAGRFQRESIDGVELLFDVAHNPAASRRLAHNLQLRMPKAGRRMAVFGAMRDKDIAAIVEPLVPSVDAWFLGDLAIARAAPATQIAEELRRQGVSEIAVGKTIQTALVQAMSLCVAGDQVVIFGSFYTIAEALACLPSPAS